MSGAAGCEGPSGGIELSPYTQFYRDANCYCKPRARLEPGRTAGAAAAAVPFRNAAVQIRPLAPHPVAAGCAPRAARPGLRAPGCYSSRSATDGRTRAARRAGKEQARKVTAREKTTMAATSAASTRNGTDSMK